MNASQLAEMLERQSSLSEAEQEQCAEMLRRQHEAINVLREDLAALLNDYDAQNISDAKQTLAETENLT